jgi:V/A-type H+-transporting ATPase subunit I
MIAPMMKYTFVIFHSHYKKFLEDVQNLGTLHVKEAEGKSDSEIEKSVRNDISDIEESLAYLAEVETDEVTEATKSDWKELVARIKDLKTQESDLKVRLEELETELNETSVWGEFSKEQIAKLEEVGVKINFYEIKNKKLAAVNPEDHGITVINTKGDVSYFMTFKPLPDKLLSAVETELPDADLGKVEHDIDEANKTLDKIAEEKELLAQSAVNTLNGKLKVLKSQHELILVQYQHTTHVADGNLKVLEGWVPSDKQKELDAFLEREDILYASEAVEKGDNAPIKLINSKFARLFEPIGELFSLPKYGELDLTVYFAPFFMLFFGFCLGDAGYGLVILLGTTLAKLKKNPKMKPYLTLGQLLGASTFVMGLLFGNIFGVSLSEQPIFAGVKDLFLDSEKVFWLSIMVGGVQVIFGNIVKVANKIKQGGFVHGLSTIGWLIIFFTAVVAIVNSTVLKDSPHQGMLSTIVNIGLAAGGFLILFFQNPGGNIFAGMAGALWDGYSTVTGVFGDLLSYIRLFALGVSSTILGLVVNQMAMSALGIKYGGPILFVLVVVVGHTANLAISSLGSFVHPMRLTLVEFYKNAGFTGGGKEYKPFSNKK